MTGKIRYSIFAAIAAMAMFHIDASAQIKVERFLARADSAMNAYDFNSAVGFCQKAMEVADSVNLRKIEEKLMTAQNGVSMMDFCSTPTVVSRRVFPVKDFFLFYPLKNNSWRKAPNQLDSLGGDGLSRAVYYPEGATEIYYSAKDEEGIRNIYKTFHKDSLWSVPALINEQLTSSSDEIYPMVSPDGKTLTFASRGLYGMGGYDLYQSTWNPDTKDWSVPVNMGFPYSSPGDDFLFINTDDGKYSIFASNRECSKDSVCVYVLEYDVMPVRSAITSVKELKALSHLLPQNDPTRMDNGAAVTSDDAADADTKVYIEKMKEVRVKRDSLERFTRGLDALRSELATAPEESKADLTEKLMDAELHLPSLNDDLKKAVGELQEIEMDFLMKGIVIDTKKIQTQVDKEIVGAASGYTFSKNSYGPDFTLAMEKPVRKFDYSFMILSEGRFAEDNELPEGLVYQIQIFTQGKKAQVSDLKGLSPVFEKKNPSGKLTYSAGVFRTYADALGNLNKVKSRGFRDAIITAYNNGRALPVSNARKLESEIVVECNVVIFPENGQSLKETALEAIHGSTGKDLLKSVEDGAIVYKVGPFNDRDEAEDLADAIKEAGEKSVRIETLD
ncbi:MAG: hypothetical protein MJY84_02880 [Bacteroidales bacterium]|nr:hypothetical protein [Bacteroidales bacterium]